MKVETDVVLIEPWTLLTNRETSFRESDHPGIVFPGNVLSGKRLSGEKTTRESNHPGNDCKPTKTALLDGTVPCAINRVRNI